MSWRGGLRRMFPYVIALFGGFLLAYLIVAFFLFPAGVIPQDVKIPNVTGLSYEDASQRLQQVGFTAQRGEMRFHATAPRLTVLEQDPPAGSRDLSGTAVTLVLSAGQQMATVPPVVGMSRAQAETTLQSAGFQIGDVLERSGDQPRGQVIESRPPSGTALASPNAVSLVISSGPIVVVAPDVVGRNFAEARSLLEQVGLTLGQVTTTDGTAPDPGAAVVSQTPPGGSQVNHGAHVDLRIAGRTP